MSMQKPQELSRKRQILLSDVQKRQGQSLWPADSWWPRHTEPGCVLDGEVHGGAEMICWTQGQSCRGVNGAEHNPIYSSSPGSAQAAACTVQPVNVNSSSSPGNVYLMQCVRGPERQLNGVLTQARTRQQGLGSIMLLPFTRGILLLMTSDTALHCSQPVSFCVKRIYQ